MFSHLELFIWQLCAAAHHVIFTFFQTLWRAAVLDFWPVAVFFLRLWMHDELKKKKKKIQRKTDLVQLQSIYFLIYLHLQNFSNAAPPVGNYDIATAFCTFWVLQRQPWSSVCILTGCPLIEKPGSESGSCFCVSGTGSCVCVRVCYSIIWLTRSPIRPHKSAAASSGCRPRRLIWFSFVEADGRCLFWWGCAGSAGMLCARHTRTHVHTYTYTHSHRQSWHPHSSNSSVRERWSSCQWRGLMTGW